MAFGKERSHISIFRAACLGSEFSLPHLPLVAIVDDDPGVRGSIASLLRSAGLVGEQFCDGMELLASADLAQIACIVTDLHMPRMDGRALQLELARRGCCHPIIVMTAFPTPAARAQMLASGARAFLTKPVDPDALLAAIEQAIG
nr:response regulator [Sphingomonas xinjiangensis]